MSTQGLVTVRKDGKVVMKVVAGCNGFLAPDVAEAFVKLRRTPTPYEAYEIASDLGFGSIADLVVAARSPSGSFSLSGDGWDEEASIRYRHTFDDATFNPRWAKGTCDYFRVVDL